MIALNDLLLNRDGLPIPFNAKVADHTLMGRFGNTMLVNADTDYNLNVRNGSVVRFYLTDAASDSLPWTAVPQRGKIFAGCNDSVLFHRNPLTSKLSLVSHVSIIAHFTPISKQNAAKFAILSP